MCVLFSFPDGERAKKRWSSTRRQVCLLHVQGKNSAYCHTHVWRLHVHSVNPVGIYSCARLMKRFHLFKSGSWEHVHRATQVPKNPKRHPDHVIEAWFVQANAVRNDCSAARFYAASSHKHRKLFCSLNCVVAVV